MKLLAILVALYLTQKALERRAPLTFDAVVKQMDDLSTRLGRYHWFSDYWGAGVLMLAPFLAIFIADRLIYALDAWVVSFIWGAGALFCCFMADISQETGDTGQAQGEINSVSGVIKEAYHRYFGVLFWFVCLGAVGALFYRIIYLLRHHTVVPGTLHHHALSAMQNAADWVPVRVVGLLFTVVGDFVNGLGLWQQKVTDADMDNERFLLETAQGALNARLADGPAAAIEDAQGLAKRTIYLSVGVVLIFTMLGVIA